MPQGPCLELGSGTGLFTPILTALFPQVISMDLSMRMLQQANGRSSRRVRADAAPIRRRGGGGGGGGAPPPPPAGGGGGAGRAGGGGGAPPPPPQRRGP
ncbi:methyltransferase domain-containing protein, partial [Streptomyces mirabilis]|uniref:methyltransferase domain-containing protein n=1 Tax=Streptomyces mirabilis TaxID=68239 RepID=UPI003721007C